MAERLNGRTGSKASRQTVVRPHQSGRDSSASGDMKFEHGVRTSNFFCATRTVPTASHRACRGPESWSSDGRYPAAFKETSPNGHTWNLFGTNKAPPNRTRPLSTRFFSFLRDLQILIENCRYWYLSAAWVNVVGYN